MFEMATVEELEKIKAEFLPPGYRVEVKDLGSDLGGIGYSNVIYLAEPVSDERTLAIFLHECAHYHLGHNSDEFRKAPAHLRDYESEVWMLDKLIKRESYYEGAYQEAQQLICNRMVRDIREPLNREDWKGIYRPAFEFLTPEQQAQVEHHYADVIEPMFRSNKSELKKWYKGKHSEQIPSMLS